MGYFRDVVTRRLYHRNMMRAEAVGFVKKRLNQFLASNEVQSAIDRFLASYDGEPPARPCPNRDLPLAYVKDVSYASFFVIHCSLGNADAFSSGNVQGRGVDNGPAIREAIMGLTLEKYLYMLSVSHARNVVIVSNKPDGIRRILLDAAAWMYKRPTDFVDDWDIAHDRWTDTQGHQIEPLYASTRKAYKQVCPVLGLGSQDNPLEVVYWMVIMRCFADQTASTIRDPTWSETVTEALVG